ncbi:putative exporter [Nonomuraea thailandensis]|uniref:Exporter n=1 Tax=Nonomuraea thailandensis TaxID=1188745 RepID=A0A9X2K5J3_9ACTN|nr:hypothetical protein [Nonomuraea thailandensis]MCP2361597.1 putative exporter [Nonomuraea thailandensis]
MRTASIWSPIQVGRNGRARAMALRRAAGSPRRRWKSAALSVLPAVAVS